MPESHSVSTIQNPPDEIRGILRRLGPGLIIAGSIVGSGELIATTKTGAEAGFALLWLIVIGCVIKIFAQVEFGRYTITTGQTALQGMDELPGPRLGVNWLVWYWVVMFVFSLAQLGGIVGGVGQALAITVPLTEGDPDAPIRGDFNQLLLAQREWDREAAPHRRRLIDEHREAFDGKDWHARQAARKSIDRQLANQLGGPRPSQKLNPTRDDFYWATIITVITAVMLVVGRYRLVQTVATALVASFTVVTIGNLLALQSHAAWAIQWQNLKDGLSFGLPSAQPGAESAPLATALAAFGIIGVGASELVAYPYWCLEKGYARFTGPREPSEAWAARARGWLRVLHWDAWCSMVIYTFATVAFYLLGAAVLFRQQLNPETDQLIPVLAEMYQPVFGARAPALFLFGAIAVLYSTFFVGSAGHARVVADSVRVFGLGAKTEESRRRWVRFFCGLFPILSLIIYGYVRAPAQLVLASGIIQAVMLPMLAAAALYFRYRRCDDRIKPGRWWDIMLWLSAVGLLVAGGWAALVKVFPSLQLL